MLSSVLDNDEILDQSGCARCGKESRSGAQMGNRALMLHTVLTAVNPMLLTPVAVNFGSTVSIVLGSVLVINREARERDPLFLCSSSDWGNR